MTVEFFGYNAFVITADDLKVIIDPGLNLYFFSMGSLIPKRHWSDATHVIVTHGDPDHYWYADRIAKESHAPLICGSELVHSHREKPYLVAARSRKLAYTTEVPRVFPMDPGDGMDIDGLTVRALPAVHGNLEVSAFFGLVKKTVTKEKDPRFALGCTGFLLKMGDQTVLNLGDTLFREEWKAYEPDLLIIPIGGRGSGNTMDEREALRAVERISPKVVLPCHYNCGFLLNKRECPANEQYFANAVRRQGKECRVLKPKESCSL